MNDLTQIERKAVMKMVDADKVRVLQNGEVHTHGSWPRGDGGHIPWWRFEGWVNDVRQRLHDCGYL